MSDPPPTSMRRGELVFSVSRCITPRHAASLARHTKNVHLQVLSRPSGPRQLHDMTWREIHETTDLQSFSPVLPSDCGTNSMPAILSCRVRPRVFARVRSPACVRPRVFARVCSPACVRPCLPFRFRDRRASHHSRRRGAAASQREAVEHPVRGSGGRRSGGRGRPRRNDTTRHDTATAVAVVVVSDTAVVW